MAITGLDTGHFLELRGVLRENGSFTLLRVHERPERGPRHIQGGGRGRVEGWLLDNRGRRMLSVRAELGTTFEAHAAAGMRRTLVRVWLPLRGNAAQAALAVNDAMVWRAPIGVRPPGLQAAARKTRDAVNVSWRVSPKTTPVDVLAIDPESTARQVVAFGVSKGSIRVPADAIPGGRMAFTVAAAANLRETLVTTNVIELPRKPPLLAIVATRLRVPAGQPLTLSAVVTDPWRRPISAPPIEWLLNAEVVGQAANLTLTPDPGTHRLTARLPAEGVSEIVTIEIDKPSGEAIRWRQTLARIAAADANATAGPKHDTTSKN